MLITECPRCHSLIQISDYSKDEMVECKFCCHTFYLGKHSTDKPPLGIKPCHIHAEQRIEDLSNAIVRNVGSDKPKYDLIRKWATEIVLQCDLAEIVDGE